MTQKDPDVNKLCAQNPTIVSESEGNYMKKHVAVRLPDKYVVLNYDCKGQAVIGTRAQRDIVEKMDDEK